jgi:hypothetical protein
VGEQVRGIQGEAAFALGEETVMNQALGRPVEHRFEFLGGEPVDGVGQGVLVHRPYR